MKGSATIDHEAETVRVEVTMATLEDVGPALDAVKRAALALWPDLAISGVDDPPEDDEPAPAKGRKPWKAPAPGSASARVLEAAGRLGDDAGAIAAALDLGKATVAMMLGRLRQGGHLRAKGG